MTREELIKNLKYTMKKHKSDNIPTFGTDIYLMRMMCKETLDYLEQELCEDCIGRQAVLDINESHHGQMPNHINHRIWQEVKDLPTVQPKPKTGHWIVDEYGIKHCPFCNAINNTVYDSYCANCGVRMESEE